MSLYSTIIFYSILILQILGIGVSLGKCGELKKASYYRPNEIFINLIAAILVYTAILNA